MKTADQRRQTAMTMTHVSRFVRELANRLDGATRRAVRGADLGGSGELLQATQALLEDLLPVAQRQKLAPRPRSEEHTSELQSLMRISYAVFCLKKKKNERSIKNTTLTQYRRAHAHTEYNSLRQN